MAELACTPGAQQAEDLALKLEALRERRRDAASAAGRTPDAAVERVATFATGTPVANSLGEMWVMQSYLRPDLLEAAGVGGIDAWGATFTGTVSTIEMNASGSKLKPVTRIGRFVNVPELVTMSSVYTDVVTRDDVPAALPTLVGGARQVLSMPADQEVRDFIVDLAWRAEHFDPKRPDMDNILKVTSDGRNVSLDPRLGNLAAPLNGGRAGAVAEQIMRIHHANADTVYRDDAGAPAPIRGALQIVFCDRATPNKDGRWSIYDGVRDELVARGMDPAGVRFVHDYPKAGEKAQLFADCRNGRVSVLLGSTEKMGTGTNIQDRAIALHHMDVPWRPADLEQREGRLIRQGNQNPEVEICNYVTEATFDTVMWLLNRTNRRGSRARRRSLSRSVRPPIGRGGCLGLERRGAVWWRQPKRTGRSKSRGRVRCGMSARCACRWSALSSGPPLRCLTVWCFLLTPAPRLRATRICPI